MSFASPRLRRRIRRAVPRAWPWLVLSLGAALPLLRVLRHPTQSLPGSMAGDIYKHAWPYWHTLALVREGTWPYTPYFNAPEGGVLLDVMLLPSVLLAPLTLVAGPVFASNTWVWLSLLAVGGASYALCKRLTGSELGALCAGLSAQTSPYLLGHGLTSGVHERLSIWIFPFLMLGLLTLREKKSRRWTFAMVAITGLTTLHCHTFGVYAAVMLVLALPMLLWPFAGAQLWPRARRLLVAYGGMGVMMAAVFLVARWFVHQPDFLAGVFVNRVELSLGVTADYVEVATPASLLDPFSVQLQRPKMVDDELHNLSYIGWVPLLAILAGLCCARRRGRGLSMAIIGLGLFFAALSLGPIVLLGRYYIENPCYQLVAHLLPFWGGLPAAWEHIGVFSALAVLGLAELVAAPAQRGVRLALASALLVGVWAERAWALPVPVILDVADARVSPVNDAARGEGGLADMPRIWKGQLMTRGTMFLAQTRHEHPLPVAINLSLTDWDSYPPLKNGSTDDWGAAASCLKRRGFRWIVVHRDWFSAEDEAAQCVEGLQAVVGPPLAHTEDEALFDLADLAEASFGRDPLCP